LDRVRKLATQLLEKYSTLFSVDFEKNKQALESVSIIRSKSLRNKIAGYITRLQKEELDSKGKVPAS
jgi:small subunit ribosomal protein S17e